jgi:hypothetical protein
MKISFLSQQAIPQAEAIKASDIRAGIFNLIQSEHPSFEKDSFITLSELNQYRRLYLTNLIVQERGELATLDKEVMDAIRSNSILSENIQEDKETAPSFGEKIADKVATFGGSWTFILIFFAFILLWMGVNLWVLVSKPIDPFPFILLNLIFVVFSIYSSAYNHDESKQTRAAG